MTTTMPTTQSYWLSGLPWASPGGRHLYPNLWLSTVSRLFNPLSPDLFPPSDDYDVSATHAAPLVSFRGRQWSIPVAASGHVSWPPVVSSSCPLTHRPPEPGDLTEPPGGRLLGGPGGPVVAEVADRQFGHRAHHDQDPGPVGRGS